MRSCRFEGLDPDYIGETWWEDEAAWAARFDQSEYDSLMAGGAAIIDQSRNTSIALRELDDVLPARRGLGRAYAPQRRRAARGIIARAEG